MQETTSPNPAAVEVTTAQPCVVIRGPADEYLVIEKRICKVVCEELVLYYVVSSSSISTTP